MTSARSHPRHGLDELIHSPVRLSVMATLAVAGECDFRFLRESVEVSDSLLSKNIAQLEAAGYLQVVKGFVGKRANTWLSLTEKGTAAFAQYQSTLSAILQARPGTTSARGGTPPPR